MTHINKLVQDYEQAKASTNISTEHYRKLKLIKRETHVMGMMKLNTYGIKDKKRNVGCRGIIRGNERVWLGGFSKSIRVCDIYTIELWEFTKVCNLHRLGFTNIDINVDFQQVVTDINTNNSSNIMGRKLISKIRSYFQQDNDIKITHVYREANLYAL